MLMDSMFAAGGPSSFRINRTNPAAFLRARDLVKADKQPFLFPYSEQELAGIQTFLDETGKVGYALKGDELVNVFSASSALDKTVFMPGAATEAVLDAMANGAKKLDCFDGWLSKRFYPKLGWKETGRIKWADEYAPDNWNYKKYDRPDVIFMENMRNAIR